MHHSSAVRLASLLAPLFLILMLPVGSVAEVVINEVLADPVSDWSGDGIIDFKNDEWVEIANAGPDPVDLDGYWLSDAGTDPAVRYRFSGSLASGETFVVTGAMAVAWQMDTGNGSAGLSLSNSGGEVALFHDVGAETTQVDLIAYVSYQMDDDRSLGRFPNAGEDWILYDGLNIYHGNQIPGSTGCLPSFGTANVCEHTPAGDANWGRVKSHYGG
ncbi:MAG: lamin tail domain-containing protein [Candidatus Krumholzibacteriia bacterium]|nr:lamin tail domain-containing protein [bacterium]MCB9512879.1 lamin tail domain-containing protein [Candidatus Latescibacterota bacterium]MCB9516965.1 lamin tail domain-containing protein [Candidatus Latescibacterota bacterium]